MLQNDLQCVNVILLIVHDEDALVLLYHRSNRNILVHRDGFQSLLVHFILNIPLSSVDGTPFEVQNDAVELVFARRPLHCGSQTDLLVKSNGESEVSPLVKF